MKTNFFLVNFVIVLSLVFSTAMTSCSSYDDEEFLFEQVDKNNGNDDDNNGDDNNNGDNNEDGLASATLLQKTFGLEDGKWLSKLTFEVVDYEGNVRDTTYVQELPFSYTLGEEEFKSTEDAKASAFVALGDADTNSTEFVKNELSNYVKKVTRTQLVSFSKFDRVLSSYHHEAYRYVAGKRYDFISSVENASFGGHDRNVSEIENEGKKFERESNLVSMNLTFNKKSFETNATTHVDRELKSNDNNDDNNGDNGDENKDDDEEINADITIDGLQSFLGWTKVYDNNRFHDCLLFESNDAYVVVIDGKVETKNIVSKSTVATSSKYVSAVYNNGSYLPATLTVNGTGWTYCGEFANGKVLTQTMSDQLAITKDIKNFSETNSAKPSPIVKNHSEVKNVNGKVVITVYGYTVNGKLNKAYTVAGK